MSISLTKKIIAALAAVPLAIGCAKPDLYGMQRLFENGKYVLLSTTDLSYMTNVFPELNQTHSPSMILFVQE